MESKLSLRSRFYHGKRLLAQILCNPLLGSVIGRIYRDQIRSDLLTIDLHSCYVNPEIKASIFWGFYERAEIRFIQQYLRNDLDVIELGSSLGVTSSHICKKLSVSRQIICVEANPFLIEILARNVARHSSGRNSIIHAAVAERDGMGKLKFFIGHDNTRSNLGSLTDNGVDVPRISLSQITSRYQLKDYSLVSDIEGAEVNFIMDDIGALDRCQQIVIELHKTMWSGKSLEIEELVDKITEDHHFSLRTQHGAVFVFEK